MVKSKKTPDEKWFDKHFPSTVARKAADEAMDRIPVTKPMSTFLDRWIEAYTAAGGKTDFKFD